MTHSSHHACIVLNYKTNTCSLCGQVLTFGEVPYVDVAPGEMVKHLQGGWRLMQPDVCTDELFTLLVRCWAISPEDRMSFTNILAQVISLIS